jgi:hypothetical protein
MADKHDSPFSHNEFEEALKRGLEKWNITEENRPLNPSDFAQELSAVLDNAQSEEMRKDALEMRLYDRLDKNLADYHNKIATLDKSAIIEMAGEIAVMTDVHFYMINCHDFDPGQAEYLLQFEFPLEVIAEKWQLRTEDISDMHFALNEVFSDQEALRAYPLHVEVANNEKEICPIVPESEMQKPSIRKQLAAKEIAKPPRAATDKHVKKGRDVL